MYEIIVGQSFPFVLFLSMLKMKLHSLLEPIVSDEKSAVILNCVLICDVLFFFGYFQGFSPFTGFYQFDSDVPGYNFINIHPK